MQGHLYLGNCISYTRMGRVCLSKGVGNTVFICAGGRTGTNGENIVRSRYGGEKR